LEKKYLLCIVYNKKQMVSKRQRTVKRQRRQRQQRGGDRIYEQTHVKKMIVLMSDKDKDDLLDKLVVSLSDEEMNRMNNDIYNIYFDDNINSDNKDTIQNAINNSLQKYKNLGALDTIKKYTVYNRDFYYTISEINQFNTITLYDIDAKPIFFITECDKNGNRNIKISQDVNLDDLSDIIVCVTTDVKKNTTEAKYKWTGKKFNGEYNSSSGKLSDFFKFIVDNDTPLGASPASSSSPQADIQQIEDQVNGILSGVNIPINDDKIVNIKVSLTPRTKGGSKSIRRRRQPRMKTRKQYKSRN